MGRIRIKIRITIKIGAAPPPTTPCARGPFYIQTGMRRYGVLPLIVAGVLMNFSARGQIDPEQRELIQIWNSLGIKSFCGWGRQPPCKCSQVAKSCEWAATFRHASLRHAERNRIGLSSFQHLRGGGLGEIFIGNVTAAKSRFQLRPNALCAQRFTSANECNPPFAQFTSHISKRGQPGRSKGSSTSVASMGWMRPFIDHPRFSSLISESDRPLTTDFGSSLVISLLDAKASRCLISSHLLF